MFPFITSITCISYTFFNRSSFSSTFQSEGGRMHSGRDRMCQNIRHSEPSPPTQPKNTSLSSPSFLSMGYFLIQQNHKNKIYKILLLSYFNENSSLLRCFFSLFSSCFCFHLALFWLCELYAVVGGDWEVFLLFLGTDVNISDISLLCFSIFIYKIPYNILSNSEFRKVV